MTVVSALPAELAAAHARISNRLGRALTDRRYMDELGQRFAAGDPDALRQVYRRYGGPVFAIAHRILRDRELTEDAVQRTFLNAWRAADRFDGAKDLGPWLFTIARRAAIDVYRREKRHRAEELADHDLSILPVSFESTWAAWEVRKAIEQLPSEEREVLHATHFEGLTHAEAGDKLGLPIGTIKSRSHRAYRRLAELLSHLEEASA
jgi:RNA polymerase sigma-70 factor (ECF subfamily)